MIKAIVTDMDGTLLNAEDEISSRTEKLLIECQKKGIKLVLASGRSYKRLLPYVEQLKMKEFGGFLIEVNGMAVQSLAAETRKIFKQLERKDIDELFNTLKNQRVEIHAMFDDGFFNYIPEELIAVKKEERIQRGLAEDYPWSGGAWHWNTDMRGGYPKQTRIEYANQTSAPLNKINGLSTPEKIEQLYLLLKGKYDNLYEIVRTCPRIVEITAKGITKGNALRYLMEQQGWKKEEVIVFGDGENDVTMFDEVKYSVAMQNAEDYVKERAAYIAKRNSEEGLACFLETLDEFRNS